MRQDKISAADNPSIIGKYRKNRRKRKKYILSKNIDNEKLIFYIIDLILKPHNIKASLFSGLKIVQKTKNGTHNYEVINFSNHFIELERFDLVGSKYTTILNIKNGTKKNKLFYEEHIFLTHEPWGMQGRKNIVDFNIWWRKRIKAITFILKEFEKGN